MCFMLLFQIGSSFDGIADEAVEFNKQQWNDHYQQQPAESEGATVAAFTIPVPVPSPGTPHVQGTRGQDAFKLATNMLALRRSSVARMAGPHGLPCPRCQPPWTHVEGHGPGIHWMDLLTAIEWIHENLIPADEISSNFCEFHSGEILEAMAPKPPYESSEAWRLKPNDGDDDGFQNDYRNFMNIALEGKLVEKFQSTNFCHTFGHQPSGSAGRLDLGPSVRPRSASPRSPTPDAVRRALDNLQRAEDEPPPHLDVEGMDLDLEGAIQEQMLQCGPGPEPEEEPEEPVCVACPWCLGLESSRDIFLLCSDHALENIYI
jgi:hypothetical protein